MRTSYTGSDGAVSETRLFADRIHLNSAGMRVLLTRMNDDRALGLTEAGTR